MEIGWGMGVWVGVVGWRELGWGDGNRTDTLGTNENKTTKGGCDASNTTSQKEWQARGSVREQKCEGRDERQTRGSVRE